MDPLRRNICRCGHTLAEHGYFRGSCSKCTCPKLSCHVNGGEATGHGANGEHATGQTRTPMSEGAQQ